MGEWDGEDSRARKFHFENSISLGHLLTTISMLGSLIVWGTSVESRLSVEHIEIATLKQSDAGIIAQIKENQQHIQETLIRLEDKLDRFKEK